MSSFEFYTPPYEHQREVFERTKDDEFHALLLEPRLGKTKITYDTAAYNYLTGRINTLLVIAPNGVHRNWVTDEAPKHLHPATRYRLLAWRSGITTVKSQHQRLREIIFHDGLAVVAVNVEGLITKTLRDYLTALYRERSNKVLAVVDESLDISGHDAKRTEIALRIGARSVMRRILDGTPAAASPLGLYTQFTFLKTGCLGFISYHAFKSRYVVMKKRDFGPHDRRCPECRGAYLEVPCSRCGGEGRIGTVTRELVVGYQNVEELKERVAAHSTRLTRNQCFDLPPKIYEKVPFALSSLLQNRYDSLASEYRLELAAGVVDATMVLTRYLRLQQITSNFVGGATDAHVCAACGGDGCEACGDTGMVASVQEVLPLDRDHDPRLQAFERVAGPLIDSGQSVIVWCRFRPDVERVLEKCRINRWRPVRYDGTTDAVERAENRREFQEGSANVFVGTVAAGGRGIDLSRASAVIFYSHNFSLRLRLQGEDRPQSVKKTDSVLYLDLIAQDTVDEKIVEALREGKRLSDIITGDPTAPWI